MTAAIAYRPLDFDAQSVARTRAWRPFPREVADLLCVEEASGDVGPRIHGRFALTLVRSPAVVRTESSASVVADSNSVLLVPAWQLYALRAVSEEPQGAVTMLLGASHAEGLGDVDRPVLVDDAELGEEVAALVAQLRRPVRPVDCALNLPPMLERLAARGTSMPALRIGRAATPLGPIRDYLRDNLGSQVTTADLARLSGFTEWHLIRAFHREFGLPPHAYHTRLRLAAAAELLSSGVRVSTAAYECGFADQSHLTRKFKEVYAVTPAAWAAVAHAPPHAASPRAVQRIAHRRRTRESYSSYTYNHAAPAAGGTR